MATKQDYFYGLGRRKESTARARLKGGKGVITINDKPALDYLSGSEHLMWEIVQPLQLIGKEKEFDISIKVSGGGLHGQAGASRLAVTKALATMNEDLRSTLKKAGFLKRDPRAKERKKYGLKRARKAQQYTKR